MKTQNMFLVVVFLLFIGCSDEKKAIQEELKQNYQALSEEQNELLQMYQEGYAIAKVNLLRLNTLKKELLLTKENLLEASLAIEKNNIKINYLQGAYNE